jgi:hypothetical protein
MPAHEVEEAIRHMLITSPPALSVPDARVTFGYRLQFDALPAIVFNVTGIETVGIGGSPHRVASVEFRAIALEVADALDIVQEIRDKVDPGTHNGVTFDAILWENRVAEERAAELGDEQGPAVGLATAQFYYLE